MEIKLGKYQHFKGDIVEVLGKALHSETMEEFVVYKHVTGKRTGESHYWVRPIAMFFETVEKDGLQIPRFKFVENLSDMDKFIAFLEPTYRKIIEGGSNIEKKRESAQRFNEFMERLGYRYMELIQAEGALKPIFFEKNPTRDELRKIQLNFLNKSEAFYQQVYASISALIMLLSHVGNRSFLNAMPFNSVSKFLQFLERYEQLREPVKYLGMANDFRVRAVDHVQQFALHDWMTMRYLGKYEPEVVVIYFTKNGNEIYYRPYMDPYSPSFQPPVNYKEFFVSPPYKEVYFSFIHVVEVVLNDLALNNQS